MRKRYFRPAVVAGLVGALFAFCACSPSNGSAPGAQGAPSITATAQNTVPSSTPTTPHPKASASTSPTVPHVGYSTSAPDSLSCQALASFAPQYIKHVVYLGQPVSPDCNAFDAHNVSNNIHLSLVDDGSATADNAQAKARFNEPSYELCVNPVTTKTLGHVQVTYCNRPLLFGNHSGQELTFVDRGYYGYLTTEITPNGDDPKLTGAILSLGHLFITYIESHG